MADGFFNLSELQWSTIPMCCGNQCPFVKWATEQYNVPSTDAEAW